MTLTNSTIYVKFYILHDVFTELNNLQVGTVKVCKLNHDPQAVLVTIIRRNNGTHAVYYKSWISTKEGAVFQRLERDI